MNFFLLASNKISSVDVKPPDSIFSAGKVKERERRNYQYFIRTKSDIHKFIPVNPQVGPFCTMALISILMRQYFGLLVRHTCAKMHARCTSGILHAQSQSFDRMDDFT